MVQSRSILLRSEREQGQGRGGEGLGESLRERASFLCPPQPIATSQQLHSDVLMIALVCECVERLNIFTLW